MNNVSREMTLEEYVGKLNQHHKARVEFEALEARALAAEKELVACNELLDYTSDKSARLMDERDAAMIALTNLTPGGSEYANDIDACVKWVRDRFDRSHEQTKSQVKRRKEVEAECERLKKKAKELVSACEFVGAMMYRSKSEFYDKIRVIIENPNWPQENEKD